MNITAEMLLAKIGALTMENDMLRVQLAEAMKKSEPEVLPARPPKSPNGAIRPVE